AGFASESLQRGEVGQQAILARIVLVGLAIASERLEERVGMVVAADRSAHSRADVLLERLGDFAASGDAVYGFETVQPLAGREHDTRVMMKQNLAVLTRCPAGRVGDAEEESAVGIDGMALLAFAGRCSGPVVAEAHVQDTNRMISRIAKLN